MIVSYRGACELVGVESEAHVRFDDKLFAVPLRMSWEETGDDEFPELTSELLRR